MSNLIVIQSYYIVLYWIDISFGLSSLYIFKAYWSVKINWLSDVSEVSDRSGGQDRGIAEGLDVVEDVLDVAEDVTDGLDVVADGRCVGSVVAVGNPVHPSFLITVSLVVLLNLSKTGAEGFWPVSCVRTYCRDLRMSSTTKSAGLPFLKFCQVAYFSLAVFALEWQLAPHF